MVECTFHELPVQDNFAGWRLLLPHWAASSSHVSWVFTHIILPYITGLFRNRFCRSLFWCWRSLWRSNMAINCPIWNHIGFVKKHIYVYIYFIRQQHLHITAEVTLRNILLKLSFAIFLHNRMKAGEQGGVFLWENSMLLSSDTVLGSHAYCLFSEAWWSRVLLVYQIMPVPTAESIFFTLSRGKFWICKLTSKAYIISLPKCREKMSGCPQSWREQRQKEAL